MSSNPLETPKGFRYPIYTDSPDVPRDLQNLAGDIDAYLSINRGPGYLVYSQSSVTMAYGSLTFNTPKNSTYNPNGSGAYAAGDRIRIIYTTTPSIFMEGVITSVNENGFTALYEDRKTRTRGFEDLQDIEGMEIPRYAQAYRVKVSLKKPK